MIRTKRLLAPRRSFAGLTFSVLISVIVAGMAGCEKSTGPRPDTKPPSVVETFPENGATNVSVVHAIVGVTFSEPVERQSVVFSLTQNGSPFLEIQPTPRDSGNIIEFGLLRPPLAYEAIYVATIASGLRDLAGNVMREDYSWSFTTEDEHAKVSISPPTGGGEQQSADEAEGGMR